MAVRMPRRISGIALVQWVGSDKHLSAPFKWRWKRSTNQLAMVWYVVERILLEPKRRISCVHRFWIQTVVLYQL